MASAKGVWDALFILYVIWPALLLYHVMSHSGGYDALRRGIELMSRNELFGRRGAGLGVRVLPAGHRRLRHAHRRGRAPAGRIRHASGLRRGDTIIAHIWGQFYGTPRRGLVGHLAGRRYRRGDHGVDRSLQAALLISIQAVLGGFTTVWLYGRWAAIRSGWPAGAGHRRHPGLGQVAAVYVDPVLAAFCRPRRPWWR